MSTEETMVEIRLLFSLLQQSGAILGRTKTHIVLDSQAMPGNITWMTFSPLRLEVENERDGAIRPIFSNISLTDGCVLLEISDTESAEHLQRQDCL